MINWAGLKNSGRVKDINVPWSPEELHAIHVLKIPVEDVRNGILTLGVPVEEVIETIELKDDGALPEKPKKIRKIKK
jgi:hypothetical protein